MKISLLAAAFAAAAAVMIWPTSAMADDVQALSAPATLVQPIDNAAIVPVDHRVGYRHHGAYRQYGFHNYRSPYGHRYYDYRPNYYSYYRPYTYYQPYYYGYGSYPYYTYQPYYSPYQSFYTHCVGGVCYYGGRW